MAEEVEAMKDFCYDVVRGNSLKQQCLRDKKDLSSMFEKLARDVSKLRTEHMNSEERLHVLETLIDMKAQEKDVKEIKMHLECIPNRDQIQDMSTYMNKNITEF